MADQEKFIKCSCHGEGMLLTKFDGEEEIYVSFWREGINPVKLTWWTRLKLCWMALTKGNYYEDQLILRKEEAMELSLWVQNEYDHVTEWVREMEKETLEEVMTSDFPRIYIHEVVDNPDETCKVEFTTNKAFDDLYKKEKGRKRASKKGLGEYFLELLKKGLAKEDGMIFKN